jgi:hypothetical protein
VRRIRGDNRVAAPDRPFDNCHVDNVIVTALAAQNSDPASLPFGQVFARTLRSAAISAPVS